MSVWNPKANDIFLEAAECATAELQQAFLDKACAYDSELRQQVESLLAADLQAPTMLDRQAPLLAIATERQVTDLVGIQIGPYKLREQLAEGGMGVVYVAEQMEPVRRKVALKIIKPGMASHEVIARFEAERQALALMDHPHIARMIDAGTTDFGQPFFVMELVLGAPITQYCDEHAMSTRERLQLFVQVCGAVQHAHQKGIIHRDIKPSNVLVAEIDGRAVPKVIDFGVAKAVSGNLSDQTIYTHVSQMVGTPLYMSPEQVNVGVLDIDTRSDCYSLGVVLYELLTGSTPFDRETLKQCGWDEFRRMIRDDEPPRPSTMVSTLRAQDASTVSARRRMDPRRPSESLRGELDWIVMKSLEKDRDRRYETTSKFAEDVQNYLDGKPVMACPPSLLYRWRKTISQHKAGVTLAAAVFATLLIGATATAWQAQLAWKAERAALQAADTARREATRAQSEAAISDAVNRFLNEDVLSAASPVQQADPNIKLRTVLDLAAKNVQDRFQDNPLIEAAIHDTLASTYHALGEWEPAEHHRRLALPIWNDKLGTGDPRTLRCQLGLAKTLNSRAKYADAKTLAQTVIAKADQEDGGIDISLSAQGQFADILDNQGQHTEAAALLVDLIAKCTEHYGSTDAETLHNIARLGLVRDHEGNSKGAEELLNQVWEAQQQALGPDHLQTLCSLHNLAGIWIETGNYEQAEQAFARLVNIRRQVLGLKHPGTLASLHNLAITHFHQGRYAAAEQLDRELIAARREVLGDEHPLTLSTLNNLAAVLNRQEKFADAVGVLTEVVQTKERLLGKDHRDTLISIAQLANAIVGTGDMPAGVKLQRELVERSLRTLGEEHPLTLGSRNDLASTLCELKEFPEAELLFRNVLQVARRTLGAEHLNTLVIMSNVASAVGEQGKLTEAEQIYREVLETKLRVLPKEHPSTLVSMNGLSDVLFQMGQHAEAEKLAREVIDPATRILGEQHSTTTNAMENLANALAGQRKHVAAAEQHSKLAEIFSSLQDNDQSIEHLTKASELDPGNVTYAEQLAASQQARQLAPSGNTTLIDSDSENPTSPPGDL